MEDNHQPPDNHQQRPPMLTLLCVFTFAGSGLSAFANLILYLFYDLIKQMFEAGQFNFTESGLEMKSLKMVMNVSPGFFLFQGILYLVSLMGAIMMWKLNRTGFHLYAIAQILLLIIYEFYIPGAPFPIIPLLLSIIFILLYYRNLKFMK